MFEDKNTGISPFNSLMSVLAATVGTGNVIGVATAITIGGIGSIFWIFISGIFAISTKYAETYIVFKYRKKDKTGYFGGAMYVLKERIGSKLLGNIFAILVIISTFGIGCMIQSNSVSNSMVSSFNLDVNVVAMIVTILSFFIIFSSAKIISKVSSIFIPISTVIYIVMCIVLLYIFRDNILITISNILKDAFSLKAGVTGIFTYGIIKTISSGLSKGMFSNEAGMGTSPIFSCTVNSNNTYKQATIASISVFIDTVVLCTLTGLVLCVSNDYIGISNPVELVQNVFNYIPYGNILLTICLTVFGLLTIPCFGYYGIQAVKYLYKDSLFYIFIYKIIYVCLVYVGCISAIQVVWSLSGIANALMTLPNLYMIYYLIDEIKTTY